MSAGGEIVPEAEKVITVEIKVSFHCNACEKQVKKALSQLDGVQTILTDMENQKATVKGQVDPQIVLKKLRKKTGKRAELWPRPVLQENPPSGEGNAGVTNEVSARPAGHNSGESSSLLTSFDNGDPNSCTIC